LDIFPVGEDLDEFDVSISDDVGDSLISDVDGVSVIQDLTTEGEDNEFEGVSGDFSVAEEDQTFEEVSMSVAIFVIHLLNGFILVEFIRDSVFFILDFSFDGVFLVFDEESAVAEGVEVSFQFDVDLGRVLQAQRRVELKVDELEHGFIELQESEHDSVVDFSRQLLGEMIWNNPSDSLSLNISLVVYSLNTKENLSQRSGFNDVKVEFLSKLGTLLDSIIGDVEKFMGLEDSEKVDETKRIIQVSQGISESGISFLNQMIKGISGHVFLESLGLFGIVLSHVFFILLDSKFHVLELLEDFFMSKVVDILGVVVGLVSTS